MAACRGGALPGTELMVKKAESGDVNPQELTIGIVHALLGDQQDDRAQHQDSAQYIEDGGAHAAGGGQERTGLVLDLSGNRKLGFSGAAIYLNFIRLFQLIVTGRSLGFYQIVGAVGKAIKGGRAIIVGCHDSASSSDSRLFFNPFDLLIGIIPLVVEDGFFLPSGYFLVQDKFRASQLLCSGAFGNFLNLVDNDLGAVDIYYRGRGGVG